MTRNPSSPDRPVEAPASDPNAAIMARNGIVRTETFHYHVEGYRYTRLGDALAQVARSSRAGTAGL